MQGFGDNNGLIQSRTVGVGVNYGATGETILFWRHLVEAGMMEGLYGTGISPSTGDADALDISSPELYMPNTKFSNDIRFRVIELNGIHYYWLSSHNTIEISGQVSLGNGMPPFDAYSIDQKMDDGRPNTGAVLAAAARCSASSANIPFIDACWSATPNNTACITGIGGSESPQAEYFLQPNEVANDPRCGLLARFN